MKLLSDQSIRQVSAGTFSKIDYYSNTNYGAMLGCASAIVTASLISPKLPYMRIAYVIACTVFGYAVAAVAPTASIKGIIDNYFCPEE